MSKLRVGNFFRLYRNAIVLGVAFLFLFTGFNTVQAMMTKLNPGGSGLVALASLYSAFALFNFVSATVVRRLGAKLSLGLGGLTYFIFLLSTLSGAPGAMVPAAILLGCGAAVLWTANGAYLAAIAGPHAGHAGRFSSVFWSIFIVNIVVGNLFSGAFFSSVADPTVFLVVMSVCSLLGCLLFVALQKPPAEPPQTTLLITTASEESCEADPPPVALVGDSVSGGGPLSGGGSMGGGGLVSGGGSVSGVSGDSSIAHVKPAHILDTLRLFADSRSLLLTPLYVYSGIAQSVQYSIFQTTIARHEMVGFVMVAFGLANVLTSLIAGPVSDKIGRMGFLTVNTLLCITAVALGFVDVPPDSDTKLVYQFVAMGLFGACDAIANTMMLAIITNLFAGQHAAAFSVHKFWMSAATGMFFFIKLRTTFSVISVVFASFSALALACCFALNRLTAL